MPKYRVVYFDSRGHAELIRQVFVLAGQEFEDYRLKEEKEWEHFLPSLPFGQVPILQEDDKTVLGQSVAIARYVARKFGLAGKTNLEQAKADMIVDWVEDFIKPIHSIFLCANEAYKAEQKKKFEEEKLPEFLKNSEKFLSRSDSEYFAGKCITWCDLSFVIGLSYPGYIGVPLKLDEYPLVATLKAKVESNPKIAEWLVKRPVTET